MKPAQAIELVSNIEGTSNLLLRGVEGVQNASFQLSEAHYYKHITDDNSVVNVIGSGPDNRFFYKLLSYKDNEVVGYECGVGYASDNVFIREMPLYYGKHENQVQKIVNNKLRFYCDPEATNIIISDTPSNWAFLLHNNNCVVCSRDKLTPKVIHINDNSFLARVNDSDLASVSFHSKEFSDVIAESLTKYTNQLSFKCSKLNANKLAVKQLQLESSNEHGAKAGTFIYDKETDSVKFYNGTVWRSLKWADEEKAE